MRVSEDHKPDRPDERRAVEARGGQVIFRGTYRVRTCARLPDILIFVSPHTTYDAGWVLQRHV